MELNRFNKKLFRKAIKTILIWIISIFCFAGAVVVAQTFGFENNILWMLKINADAKRLDNISKIRKALDKYYMDNGHYPVSTDICSSWVITDEKKDVNYISNLDKYLPNQPHDPEEKKASCPDYCYKSLLDGSDYFLTYYFKERNDKKALGRYSSWCGNYIRYDVCGKDGKCNFFNEKAALAPNSLAIFSKEDFDNQRIEDVKKIQKAVDAYYKDNGHYPISTIICSSWVITDEKKDVNYISDLDKYLPAQPHDPEEKKSSCPDYCYKSDGERYMLDYFLSKEKTVYDENDVLLKESRDKGACGNFTRYGICKNDDNCSDL